MKVHNIKVKKAYADDILNNKKTYEIRLNDRSYHVDDILEFQVVDNIFAEPIEHPLNGVRFKITYATIGFPIAEGYIILGIRKVRHKRGE